MNIDIQFKTERLYEIIQIGVHEGKRVQEIDDIKHEALCLFEVKSQPNGSFEQPDYYVIYEHFSQDNFLGQDILANDAIKFAHATVLSVTESVSLHVNDGKYYEFFAAWVNEGKQEQLQKFFEASQPIKEKYGRPAPIFHVQFQPAISTDETPFFTSSIAGLVEWDHYSDVEALLGNKEFQNLAAPLFGEAISRMEMILGKVINL
ncbi:MAG: hypothetical protein AAGG81_04335 [Chlamydiota bacterium]